MQIINQNTVTMSSLEIAELTGKEHKNVLRDIRFMLAELQKDGSDLSHVLESFDARGYTAEFRLDKELTETLLTGYSIPLRRKVIARLNELENGAKSKALPQDYISALEQLLESKKLEQAAIEQRDHAIATKAQIGSKREASAMAKASSAVREVNRLKSELGRNKEHATIIAVERAAGRKLAKTAYVALRKWCNDNGIVAVDVADPRYGTVKAWPAQAWLEAFRIDLAILFESCGGRA